MGCTVTFPYSRLKMSHLSRLGKVVCSLLVTGVVGVLVDVGARGVLSVVGVVIVRNRGKNSAKKGEKLLP